jgi:hypothetical protein
MVHSKNKNLQRKKYEFTPSVCRAYVHFQHFHMQQIYNVIGFYHLIIISVIVVMRNTTHQKSDN